MKEHCFAFLLHFSKEIKGRNVSSTYISSIIIKICSNNYICNCHFIASSDDESLL